MMSSIFWDVTPCNPLKVNRHFVGIFPLQFQDRKIREVKNKRETRLQAEWASTLVSFSAYCLILKMERTCSSEPTVDFQIYG
jgi:hypothetical protein